MTHHSPLMELVRILEEAFGRAESSVTNPDLCEAFSLVQKHLYSFMRAHQSPMEAVVDRIMDELITADLGMDIGVFTQVEAMRTIIFKHLKAEESR